MCQSSGCRPGQGVHRKEAAHWRFSFNGVSLALALLLSGVNVKKYSSLESGYSGKLELPVAHLNVLQSEEMKQAPQKGPTTGARGTGAS